jgi:anthranilate phosphoribosyltransferase
MKKILDSLYRHQHLNYESAHEILINIAKGAYNPSQIASFLTVFMMRPVTVEELSGFRDALLELRLPINLGDHKAVDLCGTGGDEKNTFNISTLSSFIVAGTGVKVAKHGNYGVSSISGSSNLLEHFGYRFSNDESRLNKEIDSCGICFMHAPLFHPAMKTVAPIRRELGVKTFFNMLGPMVNPAQPACQMVGVFSQELARLYHYIYQQGNKQYAIVYGQGGYDECSLTSATRVMGSKGEQLLEPEAFGFSQVSPSAIAGGASVEEAANIFIQILNDEGTQAQEQVVISNAALALQCVYDETLTDSVERAMVSLKSGAAKRVFTQLIEMQA